MPGKPKPLGKPFTMSIDNNPGSTKGMAKNDVRGLPPHTRKSGQGVHRRRDLAAEFFDELACAFLQRLGLGAEKSQCPNNLLDVLSGSLGEAFGVGITAEQFRGDSIDGGVRALGGENHRDQQLEGVALIERHLEFRIDPRQARGDGVSPRPFFGKPFSLPLAVFGFCGGMELRQLNFLGEPGKLSCRRRLLYCPVPLQS